mmetsp:Transcript_59152/g.153785  ORF Transcript_59152/g.153785 Transcript_59152/m.153785 type:complete len:82 (+) Transcript_59152:328-573(+)
MKGLGAPSSPAMPLGPSGSSVEDGEETAPAEAEEEAERREPKTTPRAQAGGSVQKMDGSSADPVDAARWCCRRHLALTILQ